MRARAAGALIAAAGATTLAGGSARAQTVLELVPTAAVGATDNAAATTAPNPVYADQFGTVGGNVRVRHHGARTDQALGYRLTWMHFLHHHGIDALSHEGAWQSAYTLTGTLDLRVGASGALSRTSAFLSADPATFTPTAVPVGDNRYITATVNQELSYQPSLRRRYSQSLLVSNIHYLEAQFPLPDTTNVAAAARGEWQVGQDLRGAELSFTDSYVSTGGPRVANAGHRLFGQVVGTWRRDLSAVWTAAAQAGGVAVFTLDGRAVVGPTGGATLGYRRTAWFATLTASQTTAPNIFLGNATINDQLMARAVLPLTRDDRLFIAGFAGYTYARLVNSGIHFGRAYDTLVSGVSLTARAAQLPFWAALDYSINDQRGNIGDGGTIPDMRRQIVMLTIGGAFAFGPGTPPLFHGVL